MEERTGRRGQNESQTEAGRLVGAAEANKERAECQASEETLALPKRKSGLSAKSEQLARTPKPLMPNGKGTELSVQSTKS